MNRSTTAGILCASFLLVGCASLPKNFEAKSSHSFERDNSTSLGKIFEAEYAKHPHQSAFQLLNTSESAFLARLCMAEMAEKSIDAQYFIWDGDRSGIILLSRMVQAAERGVRVRLLLDDLTTHGKDLSLAALDQHENIEIRLFNPLGRRYYLGIFRSLSMAFHMGRMTNRMHNKVFSVDNHLVIVGGRNIADEYFGLGKRLNFRDMDVLAAGPITAEVSAQFDNYWNSPWAVPLEVFKIKVPSKKKLERKVAALKKKFDKAMESFPYKIDFKKEAVLEHLQKKYMTGFIWSPSEVICDAPNKAWEPAHAGRSSSAIVNRLSELAQSSKEAAIVSPYLLLSDREINQFKARIQGGMKVKILTNSMTSTDAIPVVAHYKGSRKKLLEAGVELHEVRPDAEIRRNFQADKNSKAIHGLHEKVTVLNNKDVFIGTFNIDPRSQHLNTEVGILIHSEELSRQVLEALNQDLLPTNSWKLSLNSKGKVEWHGEVDGKTATFNSDPRASLWRRFLAGFLGLLPLKGQL